MVARTNQTMTNCAWLMRAALARGALRIRAALEQHEFGDTLSLRGRLRAQERNSLAARGVVFPRRCEEETTMRKLALALLAAATLSACGTNTGDRALSGAGIGAGVGLLGGPPGVIVGGAVGAATGAATSPSDVNLGQPAWK
jgi:osmotically inducible lipoprotein OsmB